MDFRQDFRQDNFQKWTVMFISLFAIDPKWGFAPNSELEAFSSLNVLA